MQRRLLSIVAGLAGLLLVAVSAGSALAGRRVALVIGNAAYQNASSLSNTINDATAMTRLFVKAGFDVIESRTDLGVVAFKRAIRDFMFTAHDADIAVVYFAGHGIEIRGSNYLIPVDAKLRSEYDAEDEAVSLERIILAVEPAKQLRLIILDACRDNPFISRMERSLAVRALTGGLAPVEPNHGNTLIAYAAKGGSVSYDGDGPNSPFTTALVKHITEPGLDIRIALGRVRDEVLKMTANKQEPFVYGSLGGATIALVPAAEGQDRASRKLGSVDSKYNIRRDYEFAERVGTQKAWESFLRVYSTGFYASLARAQLAKLNETAEKASPPVIAAHDPQSRDDSKSAPWKTPPQREEHAKLETKPAEETREDAHGPPASSVVIEEPCKRDQEKLVRLRAKPVREEVIRLEKELVCERLRLQVVRLRESVLGALPTNANRTAVISATPIPGNDGGRAPQNAPQLGREEELKSAREALQENEKVSRDRADSCKRDRERLIRLRAEPVRGEVIRLEKELACERLRPQVVRLRESVVGALPSGADNFAIAPAQPTVGKVGSRARQNAPQLRREEELESARKTQPRQKSADRSEPCKRDQERLVQLRADPVREEVVRFERELACKRLRLQVLRLRESVGLQ